MHRCRFYQFARYLGEDDHSIRDSHHLAKRWQVAARQGISPSFPFRRAKPRLRLLLGSLSLLGATLALFRFASTRRFFDRRPASAKVFAGSVGNVLDLQIVVPPRKGNPAQLGDDRARERRLDPKASLPPFEVRAFDGSEVKGVPALFVGERASLHLARGKRTRNCSTVIRSKGKDTVSPSLASSPLTATSSLMA